MLRRRSCSACLDPNAAWVAAAGNPFALTMDPGVRPVYVNPATVAYWQELAGGPGLRGV